MLKYLLGTHIAIDVIKRCPHAVADTFNRYGGQMMAVSSITVAELCHGVGNSSFPTRNDRILQDGLSRLLVLPCTEKAAAHARSEGLILATNNLCEFSRVEGLRLEN